MQPTEDNQQPNQGLAPVDPGGLGQPVPNTADALESARAAVNSPDLPQVSQDQLASTKQTLGLTEPAPSNAPPLAQTTPKPPTQPIVTPPSTADDDDLIEQEWVDKAKAIVDRTKDDPHLQNEELSKFKADYMKKRYNREIKVTEE